jgi:hypothetical protein
MSQKKIIIKHFISLLFVIVFCGINIRDVVAQSPYMQKYLPRSPLLLKEVEPPKGCRRWVYIRDEISLDKITTDTIFIKTYDVQGRIMQHTSYPSSGKPTNYFYEYPNENTERFYSIMKINDKLSVRNYNEKKIDNDGRMLDAISYQVTDEGDTIIGNDHDYVYDDSLRLIYQCDVCNQNIPIKRYFYYEGFLMTKLYEYQGFNIFINNLTYSENGNLIRYTYQTIFNGDTTLTQDCIYSYNGNLLISELQFNDFEKIWRNFVYNYDSNGHLIESHEIILDDSTTTVYNYKEDLLINSSLITSFQVSNGNVLFSAKFGEGVEGKKHNTEKKYTYDKSGNLIMTELYWDGLLQRRYRNIFE